jgi:hypothetical protein
VVADRQERRTNTERLALRRLDQLISAGRLTVALSYVLGSLVGSLAAVYLGIALGQWSPGGDRR